MRLIFVGQTCLRYSSNIAICLRAICKGPVHDANLTNSDLQGVNLRGADLNGADLEGVLLMGAVASLFLRRARPAILASGTSPARVEGLDLQGPI